MNDLISRKAAHALVQELKQYVWKSPIGTYHRVTVDIDDVRFGLDALPAIEAEPKHGRWIPVEERLPEDGEEALCLTKWKQRWVAVWNEMGDHLWTDGEGWLSNSFVTHWMPMPEPPKGE